MATVPSTPKPFDTSQKHFEHKTLKLSLTLKYSVDELRSRDMVRLMAALGRSTLGESIPEHAEKVLRAAVEAGWVVEPVLKVDKDVDDVSDLKPAHTRWYTQQIDRVYSEAEAIPLE